MADWKVSMVLHGEGVVWDEVVRPFDDCQQAMTFWGKLAATHRVPDTGNAVSGGSLLRDGKSISKLPETPYGGLVVA